MHVTLDPELARFVEGLVQRGVYRDVDEVMRAALRLLHDHHRMQLRQDIDLGLQQLERGEGQAGEEVLKRLRHRSSDDTG